MYKEEEEEEEKRSAKMMGLFGLDSYCSRISGGFREHGDEPSGSIKMLKYCRVAQGL
jgi:hypothetical protein